MGVSENSVPLKPMVFMIIIPMKKGYFIGNINPTFSDKPILIHHEDFEPSPSSPPSLRRRSLLSGTSLPNMSWCNTWSRLHCNVARGATRGLAVGARSPGAGRCPKYDIHHGKAGEDGDWNLNNLIWTAIWDILRCVEEIRGPLIKHIRDLMGMSESEAWVYPTIAMRVAIFLRENNMNNPSLRHTIVRQTARNVAFNCKGKCCSTMVDTCRYKFTRNPMEQW